MSKFRGKVQEGSPSKNGQQPLQQCHEYNSCASIQITRMTRDRQPVCATIWDLGKKSCQTFSPSETPKVLLLFQPLISVLKYSTWMIAGVDLECQFSGLPQLETNMWRAFLLVCLCLICPLQTAGWQERCSLPPGIAWKRWILTGLSSAIQRWWVGNVHP